MRAKGGVTPFIYRGSIVKIIDFERTQEVQDLHEFENVLMVRYKNNVNAFWLSHGDEDYPTLSIMVKNDLAALHYIPSEKEAGFRSIGSCPGLKRGDTTCFSISLNTADDIEELNDAIVSFSVAYKVAQEFYSSKGLPRSIEWLEL
jgi:hypothetical protein